MSFVTILFLLLMLPSVCLGGEIPYTAIVMDMVGKVMVVHEGKRSPLDLGYLLYPGDVVETAENASLTINYLESGQEEQWPGGMRFSVSKTQSEPSRSQVKKRNRKIVLPQTKHAPMGGIRLRGIGNIVKGLSNTWILEERPTFRWSSISWADSYKVTLYLKSKAEPLWQRRTIETEMPYPRSEPSLNFGSCYEWKIEALKNGNVIAEKLSCFYLPKRDDFININEQRKSIEAELSNSPEDTATRLAFIFFLEHHRLYDEAIEQYKILRKAHNESESIREGEDRLLQIRLSNCLD